MRRRFRWDKKYLYWGVTAFCVIAAAIAFYMLLSLVPRIGQFFSKLIGILSPFIWGLVISYLLGDLVDWLEKKAFLPLGKRIFPKKERAAARFGRGFSVFVSLIVFLVVLAAVVSMILPQLYSSIATIAENSPTYIANISNWVATMLAGFPELEEYVSGLLNSTNTSIFGWLRDSVLPGLGSFISNVTTGVYYVLVAVYNLIIGVIVSAYVLSNKEKVKAGTKRVMYSIFTVEAAEKLREGVAFVDKTFAGFLTGKLLDSAIIALLCYIGSALLKMPYALLVSAIVGVTNIIPFFGPIIGLVPSAIIILMVNPLKALIFVIFVIILQQVDGNIIGPRILGNSVGLNGFWIMFAIILGAGLFSFWGMLLGVPVFAVIYALIESWVTKKLRRSNLPIELQEYIGLDHIDPVTRELAREPEETPAEPQENAGE